MVKGGWGVGVGGGDLRCRINFSLNIHDMFTKLILSLTLVTPTFGLLFLWGNSQCDRSPCPSPGLGREGEGRRDFNFFGGDF